jgi:transcriptional regulator with XRE-family HTH domain
MLIRIASMPSYWESWPARAKSLKRGMVDVEIAAAVSELLQRRDRRDHTRSRGTINHWLNGKRQPDLEEFFVLCEVLGADARELLFGRESTNDARAYPGPIAVARERPAPVYGDKIREFKSKARRARRRLLP